MNAKDYLVDPTVIVPGSPSALEPDFFLHSLEIVASDGSYTSPSPLPDGQMLVSFGTGAPSSFGGDYDVYVLDPASGAKTRLLGNAGTAEVEAVAVYPRAPKGIFASALDEPNGHTTVIPDETTADVTVLDMTVLASLLFQNTDTGRVLEPDLKSFDVYEDLPPDVTSFPSSGTNTATDAYGKVYVRRRLRGTIPVADDGSAHFVIPGGMPMVLHLSNDQRVADAGPAALAARGDDVRPGRAGPPGLPERLLQRPVRGLPRVDQRTAGRLRPQPRLPDGGFVRRRRGAAARRPHRRRVARWGCDRTPLLALTHARRGG